MSESDTDLLAADGIIKSFGANHVLRGVSFSAPPDRPPPSSARQGPAKPPLLRALNALDVPDSGTVRIGEVTVDFSSPVPKSLLARYRAQSGMVFQSHNLFPHKTVLQNVIEGRWWCRSAQPTTWWRRVASCWAGGAGGQERRVSLPTIGWPAAAGGDRPCPGVAAQTGVVRRADVGAGPRARRRRPGRHQGPRNRGVDAGGRHS